MDNPTLNLRPQSDVSWLCEQHIKSKEKLSTIMSKMPKNGQLLKRSI